jgi:ubiquinone/menaquinone biosynthesis C-methylase UbiE
MPSMMKEVSQDRWNASQRLELDFWKTWTQAAPYQDLNVPKYWSEELARFGCTQDIFTGRRVLDIGCGPFGLIHFLDHAAERIRIDPLLTQYESRLPLRDPQLSLAGLAEALPLASGSIDVAICFNALDHMQDPAAALREIQRVLRPGGTLLLMIHTFPAWTRPFFWVDRLHPHHWTAAAFLAQIGRTFKIERSESARRRFEVPASKWLLSSSWKYLAANFVVRSTYARVTAGMGGAPV